MALAKRAKLLRGYVCKEDKPGSFYAGCNAVTLNFYDKQDRMQKQPNWGRHYDRLCRDAANIYRIEVQCSKSKRFNIMQVYHFPDIGLAGFLDERIAQDTIQEYYGSTVGLVSIIAYLLQVGVFRKQTGAGQRKNGFILGFV